MKQLTEACPRFQQCAVNACPLHEGYGRTLEPHEDDAEQRCRLSKLKRMRIAERYPDMAAKLLYGGMHPREVSSARREANLTPEQRNARVEKLQEARISAVWSASAEIGAPGACLGPSGPPEGTPGASR